MNTRLVLVTLILILVLVVVLISDYGAPGMIMA